ncbi:hypothetical protein ACT3S2_04125 [Arthrobacter sp. AOP36-A1-22]
MDTGLLCTLLSTAILIGTFSAVGVIWKNGKKTGQIRHILRD